MKNKRQILIGAGVLIGVIVIAVFFIQNQLNTKKITQDKVEKYNTTVKKIKEHLTESGRATGEMIAVLANKIGNSKSIPSEQMQKLMNESNEDGALSQLCFNALFKDYEDYPEEVSNKNSLAEIVKYQKIAEQMLDKIDKTDENSCKELYEKKLIEIVDGYLKKESEKQAKILKETEEQQKWEANRLSLDKFNNHIRTGMSLAAIKKIFSFDSKCELSSETNIAGYHGQMYTCKDGLNGIATFLFQNQVLQSKSQINLR